MEFLNKLLAIDFNYIIIALIVLFYSNGKEIASTIALKEK